MREAPDTQHKKTAILVGLPDSQVRFLREQAERRGIGASRIVERLLAHEIDLINTIAAYRAHDDGSERAI
jgi:hypothetical protein